MGYSPTLGRFITRDPIGYVDGMNAYQFVRSNPARYLDPFGLQTTAPTTRPAAGGMIIWGIGDNEFEVEWSIQDTTGSATHNQFGTRGSGIFKTIKVKKGPKCGCDNLLWIQYTEARKNGQVYTPPNGFPWQGIDRYPAGGRPDREPYTFLPDEQEKVNQGNAYGGRVPGMYDPTGFDSTFVDWAASGGTHNWGQYSVVTLMCIKDGKAYSVGSYVFEYNVDAQGNLTFSGRPPTQDDLDKVGADFEKNNPEYLRDVYGGDVGMMR